MKNCFLFFCITIVILLIGCNSVIDIDKIAINGENSFIITFFPNKPYVGTSTNNITDMPEPNTFVLNLGTTVKEPTSTPKLLGYNFEGWYTDEKTSIQYDFDTPVTKDLNIYAKWVKNDMTITYIHNIPETARISLKVTNMPEPSIFKIPYGIKIPLPTSTPKHYNFKFKGWFTQEKDGVLYDFNTPVKKNIKLYAHWSFLPRSKSELMEEVRRKMKIDENSPNLNPADTSLIQVISTLFRNNPNFNGNINVWNVTNVQNMNNMFPNPELFNGNISNWNITDVRGMQDIFNGDSGFNQNIDSWNVTTDVPKKEAFIGSGLTKLHRTGSN